MPKMDDIPKPRDPRPDITAKMGELGMQVRPPAPPETPPTLSDQRHPPANIPNGRLELTSIAGGQHTYTFETMPRGWRRYDRYLAISTPTGWVNWPWGSILKWETIGRKSETKRAAGDDAEA